VVIRNWPIAGGANLSARDVAVADKVCLLGDTVARTLFPDQDPIGQIIRVRNLPFRVVGVLAPKGQGQFGDDQDDFILAPYTTVQKKLLGITHLNRISISAVSSDGVEQTAVEITQVLRQRHRIASPEEDDFTVRTVEEMAQTRVEMARTMTLLLMSVASVSLLVGGIGIMNIMLANVTERIREIGIRRSLGASRDDITRQFLSEALLLTTVGGIAGILVGFVLALGISSYAGWPTAVSLRAIAAALAAELARKPGLALAATKRAANAAAEEMASTAHAHADAFALASALHDPESRTIYFPLGTAPGVLAHELGHDLDWQVARTVFGEQGIYATDGTARRASPIAD